MDRRRAVAALLALAACITCSAAAPTATNHTALELSDGHIEGCYYNFQHYGEGDRIMTNEPCLNCTCHNRMLMCYLRVCPFTKPIGQDCTVEKRADQCCPIVTCPDVPVDLLTSTSTSSPAEYGTTGIGKHDRYGCSINGKYLSEGSKVPPTPNKPCEHCYCIRNMTTCVMQECTLHVDGCTPIYHKDVCCPVRYSCDHPEDEIPLLDDMTTTVRPTPGFLLTTTTVMPVTQMTQDCVHEDQIFPDGAHIKTDKACEHCYCMKGDIVCVVQGCGTPMENEGKNCTALPLRHGQCCPDTYICEGDEHGVDLTTEVVHATTTPPRRVGVEGSGYRNEPGEPFTEIDPFETGVEGSGEEYATTEVIDKIADVSTEKELSETDDEILTITTETGLIRQSIEPDRSQNTIPDINSEKESSDLPVEEVISHTEANKEFVATTTEFKTIISDVHHTTADYIHKKDELITTETAFRKEDSDIISDEVLLDKEHEKLTTTFIDLVDATPNTDKYGQGVITDTNLLPEYDSKTTTESAKYSSHYLNTIKQNDITTENEVEISVTEKNKLDEEQPTRITSDENISPVSTTIIPEKVDLLETTSINTIINEISETISTLSPPGRIPGEGDCLLNGITYNNNTIVPSTNNCHTSCKCVSSIIKCDPIICSPPPEYLENMNDCQPMYDSPDSCCPTYVCSAKETIPPQPHSQMSGTESPKPIAESDCVTNDCVLDKEQKPDSETSIICTSDDCISKPIDKPTTQDDCDSSNCSKLPQLHGEDSVACSDDKCKVSSAVDCVDENCKNEPKHDSDTSSDKDSDNKDTQPDICEGKEECEKPMDTLQKECADETCRRKEISSIDSKIPSECAGPDCKSYDESTIVPDTVELHSSVPDRIVEVTTETITDIKSQETELPVSDTHITEEKQTEKPSDDVTKQSNINENDVTVSYISTETPKVDTKDETNQTELSTTQAEAEISVDDVSKESFETKLPVTVTESTKQPIVEYESTPKIEQTEEIYTEPTATDKKLFTSVTTGFIETKLEEMSTKLPESGPIDKATETTESHEIKLEESITDYLEKYTTLNYGTVTQKTESATEESILSQPEVPDSEIVNEGDTHKPQYTTTELSEIGSDKNVHEHFIKPQTPEYEDDKRTEQQSYTTPSVSVSETDKFNNLEEGLLTTSKVPETEVDKQEEVYVHTQSTPNISEVELSTVISTLGEPQVIKEKPEIIIEKDNDINEELPTSELPGTKLDIEKDMYGELHPTSESPGSTVGKVENIYDESHTTLGLSGPEVDKEKDMFGELHPTSESPGSTVGKEENIYEESHTTLGLSGLEVDKEKDMFGELHPTSESPGSTVGKEEDIYEESHTTLGLSELEVDKEKDMIGELHPTSESPESTVGKEENIYEESHTTLGLSGLEVDKEKDVIGELHPTSGLPGTAVTKKENTYEESHTTLGLSEIKQVEEDKDMYGELHPTSGLPGTAVTKKENTYEESHTTLGLSEIKQVEEDKDMYGELHPTSELPEIQKDDVTDIGLFATSRLPGTEIEKDKDVYNVPDTSESSVIGKDKDADAYGESHTTSEFLGIEKTKNTEAYQESYTTPRLPEVETGKDQELPSELPKIEIDKYTDAYGESYTTSKLPTTDKKVHGESHTVQELPTAVIDEDKGFQTTMSPGSNISGDLQTDKLHDETEHPETDGSPSTTGEKLDAKPIDVSKLPQDHTIKYDHNIEVTTDSSILTTISSQEVQTSKLDETITDKHEKYDEIPKFSTSVPEDVYQVTIDIKDKKPLHEIEHSTTEKTISEVTDYFIADNKITDIDHTEVNMDVTKSNEIIFTKVTENPIMVSQDVTSTVSEEEFTVVSVSKEDISTEYPEVQSTLSDKLDIDEDKIKQDGFTVSPYLPTTVIETISTSENVKKTHDIEPEKPIESEKELSHPADSTIAHEQSTIRYNEQYTEKYESTVTTSQKYTISDNLETKQPMSSDISKFDEKELESHELTTSIPQRPVAVFEDETKIPMISTEKSEEQFSKASEAPQTERESTVTLTQELTSDSFTATTPKHLINEIEATTTLYPETFDEKDHKPIEYEKSQEDENEEKLTDITTTQSLFDQKHDEADESPIIVTEGSINPEVPQHISQTTESPQSTQKSIADEIVTEETASKTTQQSENEKDDMKYQEPIKATPQQFDTEMSTIETMLVSKDTVTELYEIDDSSIPGEKDKIYENKDKSPESGDNTQFQTTLSTLLTESDKIITETYPTITDENSLNVESVTESSTKKSYDQILDEEQKRVTLSDDTTEPQKLSPEIPEHVYPHDQEGHKITTETIISSESTQPTLHLSTVLPTQEEADVEQNINLLTTESSSRDEIHELTSEKVSPTETGEKVSITEENKTYTDSIIPVEKITLRPSEQVPVSVQEEKVETDVIQGESTTLPSKLIESVQDNKQQEYGTSYTKIDDKAPEEDRTPAAIEDYDSFTTETYKPEISSVTKQTSTFTPNDALETENKKQEHKTTESSISLDIETSTSKMVDFITEKQEQSEPVHAEDTTGAQYESVTERKESDIVPSDVSTEIPEKVMPGKDEIPIQFPEESPIDNNEQKITDKTPYDEIAHEKVTQSPAHIDEELTSSVSESEELPSLTTISADKIKEDHSEIFSTPNPSQGDEEVTHKKLEPERTTEYIKAHAPDLESSTDILISTQKHQEIYHTEGHKETTDQEYTYSETTPFSVELEEHPHSNIDESSSVVPIVEISPTIPHEPQEPERGDIIPDILETSEDKEQNKPSDVTTQQFKGTEEPVTSNQEHAVDIITTTITSIKEGAESEAITEEFPSIISTGLDETKKETATGGEEIVISTSPKTTKEQETFTTEYPQIQQSPSAISESDVSTEKDINLGLKPLKPVQSEQTTISEEQLLQEIPKATTTKFEEGTSTFSPTPLDKLPKPEEKPDINIPAKVPEVSKPNEEPVEDIPSPDFPLGASGGYGQEPDYVEEDQAFGPGTCRYGGKVYVSAQQIPRDDPCDFCFCFRSDIICLQQSCPPPIHGCHEEPIQGFCCPRYECPVSMATTLNVTTTTTTTTTTLPPHFLPHAYKGAAQRRGCQIKGHTYKVGEVVRASSGPCLHCTCGGDGQMKCDPKACTPEPMLRQMIAAAVSAKRRR